MNLKNSLWNQGTEWDIWDVDSFHNYRNNI